MSFEAVDDDLGSVLGAAEVEVLRREAQERAVHEQSGHAAATTGEAAPLPNTE